jgi:hypothetical protein
LSLGSFCFILFSSPHCKSQPDTCSNSAIFSYPPVSFSSLLSFISQ